MLFLKTWSWTPSHPLSVPSVERASRGSIIRSVTNWWPYFAYVMPAVKPGGGAPNAPQQQQQQQQQRTTFRPPWVKEGPEPLPLPTAPWTLARARQKAPETEDPATIKANLKPVLRKVSAPGYPGDPSASTSGIPEQPARKTSMITIIPSRPSTDGNASKENGYDASPNAKTAPPPKAASEKTKAQQTQSRQIPIEIKSTTKPSSNKPEEKKTEVKVETKTAKRPEEKKEESKIQRKQEEKKAEPKPPQPPAPIKKEEPKVQRKQEEKSESKPPQPPAPPMPPPPMPGMQSSKPIPPQKLAKIEALKSRPRKRPDWGALMKDIENGQKGLKHVQSNDRSSPLLPRVKVKDKFMYESEKPNVHNLLLKEIQGGVRLKKVQTNDRSKPLLEGLRKFRRQLTIEEQIQKAAAEDEAAVIEDELDDIDKVRDDLQSTKQMLALELRNKEALERENKKLQTRILNLEVELEKERAKNANAVKENPEAWRKEEEQERKKLRAELENAQKTVEELENKYHDTVGQLDMTRSDLEEANRKNQVLERKLQAALSNQNGELPLSKQPSAKKLAPSASGANRDQRSPQNKPQEDDTETEESEYEYETESSEEEDEEDKEALQERRNAREIKLLTTKLASFKDKEKSARKERKSLREQIKKEQKVLKEEKKKYKALQKEVDKMAKLMKDDEDEEEEEEEEEEESEESESESESEESEEEESDGDLPPDAPIEKRKQNLTERSKRHENCLAALRKGNYLLKATLDRLKDELFKQKEMAVSMQEDLNSVLAELG